MSLIFINVIYLHNVSFSWCDSMFFDISTLWIYALSILVVPIAADVDTRAITRRLREDGSLIGVLTTDKSKTDDELIEMSKTWKIVGKEQTMEIVHFYISSAFLVDKVKTISFIG